MGRNSKAKNNVKKEPELKTNSMQDLVYQIGADVSQTAQLQTSNRYSVVTLNRALISQTYLEHGIIQVLIDQPVDDAFRGGIDIMCPELSADDIKAIQEFIHQKDVLNEYKQALKWARLYGGAGIIINAGQKMDKPFNIDSIKELTPLEFYAADRWELTHTPRGNEALDRLSVQDPNLPYSYYGHSIHRDNVIKLKNKEAPSLIRGQFSGWGVSEIEKIFRSYNQYLKHQAVTYEVLDECKIDVFKITGFNSSLATTKGTSLTASRITAASQIKNFQNAIVVDSEDDYEQKQMSFAGLSEILTQIRIGLACDLRMPMTKLFGLSAAGFNSGEDDIENYNAMIESEIRSKSKTGMIKILKVICQKLFGYVPEALDFEFKPLRIMSNKEQSVMKSESLSRVTMALNSGLCTSEKAVELLNSEKVFAIDLEPSESMSIEEMRSIDKDQNEDMNQE